MNKVDYMAKYRFDQLVDMAMIRRLLESHHRLSGMAYGLLDTDGNMLVTVGWQDICEHFHRVNPARSESNAYMQAHIHDGEGDYGIRFATTTSLPDWEATNSLSYCRRYEGRRIWAGLPVKYSTHLPSRF